MSSSAALPSRLVIAVGTYDGVLAGWENIKGNLKLTFATPVHEGSLRSLCMVSSAERPGTLVSCGFDEYLKTHDWQKRLVGNGEIRTPADFGTPNCIAFCLQSHCMVGFGNGKIVLYKKRDWSIQHVLGGHEGGVASLAVHPSGKMALTGGLVDGKLKLWDLTRGRLAFTNKVSSKAPVCSVVWSRDGQAYAWAHGNHVTVKHVGTGNDLVNVDLPSRVNQIALMDSKEEGLFVVAACNDGSLPVLAAQDIDDEEESTRRAIMAIEPVDSIVAGEERFKCIQSICGFLVATANSAGVVSVMDLSGAVRMIMDDDEGEDGSGENGIEEEVSSSGIDQNNEEEEEEEELAVDILESVRLGTGARITSLAVWSCNDEDEEVDVAEEEQQEANKESVEESLESSAEKRGIKRKAANEVEIDAQGVEKARALVSQAKKMKHKKEKKKSKKRKEKNKQV